MRACVRACVRVARERELTHMGVYTGHGYELERDDRGSMVVRRGKRKKTEGSNFECVRDFRQGLHRASGALPPPSCLNDGFLPARALS